MIYTSMHDAMRVKVADALQEIVGHQARLGLRVALLLDKHIEEVGLHTEAW